MLTEDSVGGRDESDLMARRERLPAGERQGRWAAAHHEEQGQSRARQEQSLK